MRSTGGLDAPAGARGGRLDEDPFGLVRAASFRI
jgi:hypothetical protein